MNRQDIQQELDKIKEERCKIESYSEEDKVLCEKHFSLRELLRNMDSLKDCDEELISIYEMEQQIKALEQKIKDKQTEVNKKKGFSKDIKFVDKRNNKTCIMISDRAYRVLKKDGTISTREGIAFLSTYNIPHFEIVEK